MYLVKEDHLTNLGLINLCISSHASHFLSTNNTTGETDKKS